MRAFLGMFLSYAITEHSSIALPDACRRGTLDPVVDICLHGAADPAARPPGQGTG